MKGATNVGFEVVNWDGKYLGIEPLENVLKPKFKSVEIFRLLFSSDRKLL
jgi:hypothetical protein